MKNSFRHRWNWTYIRYNHCSCKAISVIHRSKDSFRTMKTIKIWLSNTATKYKLYILGANNWTSVGASVNNKDSFLSHINKRSSNFWKGTSPQNSFRLFHDASFEPIRFDRKLTFREINGCNWLDWFQRQGILYYI